MPLTYEPWLGLDETRVRPGGSSAATSTPVAPVADWLSSVTVNVTSSPMAGASLSATMTTARSVGCAWTETVAASSPAPSPGVESASGWSAEVTWAAMDTASDVFTVATMSKSSVCPAGRLGMVQTPVAGS